ncbi:MAG: ParB/RepB/Spo0J family partition protein, partial [Proteobacteria bacterium]|nr:ParB/RepB/Spo0J family partition protein [Pseudomonadota bacterium]
VLEIGLIEHLQREDLNPLDEAEGYKRLADEFGHTQEKIAETLGKSRSHVANMLRLLNLPEKIRMLVKKSSLTAGHARALAAMEPESAERLAELIIEKGLSVRDAEALAAANSGRPARGKKKGAGAKGGKDVDTLALEEEVGNAIGAKVSIDMKPGGDGSMTITFKTLDQLDEVLHRLSHNPGRLKG